MPTYRRFARARKPDDAWKMYSLGITTDEPPMPGLIKQYLDLDDLDAIAQEHGFIQIDSIYYLRLEDEP